MVSTYHSHTNYARLLSVGGSISYIDGIAIVYLKCLTAWAQMYKPLSVNQSHLRRVACRWVISHLSNNRYVPCLKARFIPCVTRKWWESQVGSEEEGSLHRGYISPSGVVEGCLTGTQEVACRASTNLPVLTPQLKLPLTLS